jgi:hypothetical protein
MFFGSIEHEIVGEIAKNVNGQDGTIAEAKLEPVDWERLGHFRQPEVVTTVETQNIGSIPMLLWQAGNMLVTAGQKMMQTAERAFDEQCTPAQASSENC